MLLTEAFNYCPPPFRRKARGHGIWLSVVRGSEFVVGTL